MFRIIKGKGFHVTFYNGVTVSVQLGVTNYCATYSDTPSLFDKNPSNWDKDSREQAKYGTRDAELAIMYKEEFITSEFSKEEDGVMGFVSPETVLKAMIWAEAYLTKEVEA